MATFNIYVKKIKDTIVNNPLLQLLFTSPNECQTLFEFLVWAPIGATVNLSFIGPVNDNAFITIDPNGSGFITLGTTYSFQPNGVFRPLRVLINNTVNIENISVEVTAQQGVTTEVITVDRDSTGENCY